MYVLPAKDAELTQGDIIDACPIVTWDKDLTTPAPSWRPTVSTETVFVLSQACDLVNAKTTRVQIAVVHEVEKLIKLGVAKPAVIRDQIRTHRVFGLYFLPEAEGIITESIVDLRDIHTVPRQLLEELCRDGKRLARMTTPFREHLAQHFAVTFSRIALPHPYETK